MARTKHNLKKRALALEEAEEAEENSNEQPERGMKQAVTRQRQPNPESRFASFKLGEIEFSLTMHKVQRPRRNLVAANEYVISNEHLYQIVSDVPLPEVQPGYSVDQLLEQEVKAYRFEVATRAAVPTQRTRYSPCVMPELIKIREIDAFADVYEPVGCDVALEGVILSGQAKQDLYQLQRKCRIIPASHWVRLENRVLGENGEPFVEAFADVSLKKEVPVESNSDLDFNALQEDIERVLIDAPEAEAPQRLVAIAQKFDPNRNGQVRQVLRERFIIYHALTKQADKKEFCKRVVTMIHGTTKLCVEKALRYEKQFINDAIFAMDYAQNPIAELLAASPELSQNDIKDIFEFATQGSGVSKMQMAQQFVDMIPTAFMHKNFKFVYAVINNFFLPPPVFGQLAQIALNAKLQMKDIKVGITQAKMFNIQMNTLAFAGFADAAGFIAAVQKVEGINYQELKEEHKSQITIGCCANIKDNLDLVKTIEQLIGGFVPSKAITAALMAQNRRILAYVMSKYKTQDVQISEYARYLNAGHFEILQNQFVLSPAMVGALSRRFQEPEILLLLRRLLGQTVNGVSQLHLYKVDLMTGFILNQQVELIKKYLSWGYSFAKAHVEIDKIATVLDQTLFNSVVDLIVSHYRAMKKDLGDAWLALIYGTVKARDLERVRSIQSKFQGLVSSQFMAEKSPELVSAFLAYQNPDDAEQTFKLEELDAMCAALDLKLINGYTISQWNQAPMFGAVDLLHLTADHAATLGGLTYSFIWHVKLGFELTGHVIAHFSGSQQETDALIQLCSNMKQTLDTLSRTQIMMNHTFAGRATKQAQSISQVTDKKEMGELREKCNETIKFITSNPGVLATETDRQKQFVQNYVAELTCFLQPKGLQLFFDNADLTLRTKLCLAQKNDENVQLGLLGKLKAEVEDKCELKGANADVGGLFSDPLQKKKVVKEVDNNFLTVHDQNVLHFCTCSSAEQFRAFLGRPEIKAAMIDEPASNETLAISNIFCSLTSSLLRLGQKDFDALIPVVLAALHETDNIRVEADAFCCAFSAIGGIVYRHEMLVRLNKLYEKNELPQMLKGRNGLRQTLMHCLAPICALAQTQDAIDLKHEFEKLVKSANVAGELAAAQDCYGCTPLMIAVHQNGMSTSVESWMCPPTPTQQDCELNNLLHYALKYGGAQGGNGFSSFGAPAQFNFGQGFGTRASRTQNTIRYADVPVEIIKLVGANDMRVVKRLLEQENAYKSTPLHIQGSCTVIAQAVKAEVDLIGLSASKCLYNNGDEDYINALLKQKVPAFIAPLEDAPRAYRSASNPIRKLMMGQRSSQNANAQILRQAINLCPDQTVAAKWILGADLNEMMAAILPEIRVKPDEVLAELLLHELGSYAFMKQQKIIGPIAERYELKRFLTKELFARTFHAEPTLSQELLHNLRTAGCLQGGQFLGTLLAKTASSVTKNDLVMLHANVTAEALADVIEGLCVMLPEGDSSDEMYANFLRDLLKKFPPGKEAAAALIRLFVQVKPGATQQNYKGKMKEYLAGAVRANINCLTKAEMQAAVNSASTSHASDELLDSFLAFYHLQRPSEGFWKLSEKVQIPVFDSAQKVEILKTLVEEQPRPVLMEQKNKLFQTPQDGGNIPGVLYFKGQPCSVCGFRRCGPKLAVYAVRVNVSGDKFMVTKKAVCFPAFNARVTVAQSLTACQASRKKRVSAQLFQDPFEAFTEFERVLAKKSDQNFAQIVAQEDTLLGAQSQRGYNFYLVKDEVEISQKASMMGLRTKATRADQRDARAIVSEIVGSMRLSVENQGRQKLIAQYLRTAEALDLAMFRRHAEKFESGDVDKLTPEQQGGLLFRLTRLREFPMSLERVGMNLRDMESAIGVYLSCVAWLQETEVINDQSFQALVERIGIRTAPVEFFMRPYHALLRQPAMPHQICPLVLNAAKKIRLYAATRQQELSLQALKVQCPIAQNGFIHHLTAITERGAAVSTDTMVVSAPYVEAEEILAFQE